MRHTCVLPCYYISGIKAGSWTCLISHFKHTGVRIFLYSYLCSVLESLCCPGICSVQESEFPHWVRFLRKPPLISLQGAASADEFYAKNSRWTEGLISASKAVGWGATQILYVLTNNPLFKTLRLKNGSLSDTYNTLVFQRVGRPSRVAQR
jgi:hypothetical protein